MSDNTAMLPDIAERAYELGEEIREAVLDAVARNQAGELLDLLDPLHPADIADFLEQIGSEERMALLDLWGQEIDAEVISELDENLRADVIGELPDAVIADAVRELESDDVVDLIEDLGVAQAGRVLEALEDADRVAVERSLQYPEETAGRLMQRTLVMAPDHWNVGEVIDHLRASGDLPDRFYHVFVVDPSLRPIGKIRLSRLLTSTRGERLAGLMDENFRAIPVLQAQEDVAYAFNQYNMVSAPVVDEDGRLVGVINMDDAMEVLEEEAEEDIKRLAGVGDESLTDSILDITRRRFPWLAVNLLTSVLASMVIAQFSGTIEAIVALAVLMPIVASMGGNAGTQTLTVAVRAMATKDLTSANSWRVVWREVAVGLVNGLVFALIIGVVGYVWFSSVLLGVVLGLAMIGNLLVAGMAGILIPMALDKLRIDPALASGAFVTTVTDIVGFFAFLGLAAAILL